MSEETKPFTIFRIKPGTIPDVNLWLMRHVFKHLATGVFIPLKLSENVIMSNPQGIVFEKDYDDKGEYVIQLKVAFTLTFEPSEEES